MFFLNEFYLTENIKNSSIKQEPNGKRPAIRVLVIGFMYHTWSGT